MRVINGNLNDITGAVLQDFGNSFIAQHVANHYVFGINPCAVFVELVVYATNKVFAIQLDVKTLGVGDDLGMSNFEVAPLHGLLMLSLNLVTHLQVASFFLFTARQQN